jgi:ketosteroid isomerase-like protein
VTEGSATDPVEIFRMASTAVIEGDLDAGMEYLQDDVVFDWTRSRGPLQGLHEGSAAARDVWESMLEVWRPIAWEVEVLARPDPETVVLGSRPRAQGRGSGIELQGRGGLVVKARDGKLARITLFQSPDEALAAVAEGRPELTEEE